MNLIPQEKADDIVVCVGLDFAMRICLESLDGVEKRRNAQNFVLVCSVLSTYVRLLMACNLITLQWIRCLDITLEIDHKNDIWTSKLPVPSYSSTTS